MAHRRLTVEPTVLEWARRTAGLSIDEAARRIGVASSRVSEWESGRSDPTIGQLRHAAETYTRPLAALFLDQPVEDEAHFELPDFRRPEVEGQESAVLRRAILRARRQRDAMQEIVSDGAELSTPSTAQFQLDRALGAEEAGAALRTALGLGSLPSRIFGKPEELLRKMVLTVERLGFLVIQVQRVPLDEMRGFSLAGDPASIIALNSSDWPRGKVFTLIHELTHVASRQDSLCDLSRVETKPEERYCDEVAASALMPKDLFFVACDGVDATKYSDLRELGDHFGVSAEAALIRMIQVGRTAWDTYPPMKATFREAYAHFKQEEKNARGDKEAPIYYQLKVRDLGRPFIATVLRAHDDGLLSSRDVTQLLEVSYDKIPKLAARLGSEVNV